MLQCLQEARGSLGPVQQQEQPWVVQQALWQEEQCESVQATIDYITRSIAHPGNAPARSTRTGALSAFFC
jgi:hypothetical protein